MRRMISITYTSFAARRHDAISMIFCSTIAVGKIVNWPRFGGNAAEEMYFMERKALFGGNV